MSPDPEKLRGLVIEINLLLTLIEEQVAKVKGQQSLFGTERHTNCTSITNAVVLFSHPRSYPKRNILELILLTVCDELRALMDLHKFFPFRVWYDFQPRGNQWQTCLE